MDLAQRAGLNHLHDAPVGGPVVVDVVAHLRDALVLVRRGHHGAAFADGIGERLLDEDVLAGAAGVDEGQRVPVVGRPHHDGVEFLALQQLAEIVERLGLAPLRFFDRGGGAIEVRLVQIADGGGVHVRLPHELVEPRGALAAESDEADLNLVARRAPSDSRGRQSKHESSSVHTKYSVSEVRQRIGNRLLTRAAPFRAATVRERLLLNTGSYL